MPAPPRESHGRRPRIRCTEDAIGRIATSTYRFPTGEPTPHMRGDLSPGLSRRVLGWFHTERSGEHLADNSVLNAPGLRGFERQVVLRVAGRGYRVDAFDVESRTAIEFDGAKYHSDDRARRRDLERDVDLASIGVQTLRFTFEDVADRPSWCRDQILRTIATRRRH